MVQPEVAKAVVALPHEEVYILGSGPLSNLMYAPQEPLEDGGKVIVAETAQ
jgi:hypothetical protein